MNTASTLNGWLYRKNPDRGSIVLRNGDGYHEIFVGGVALESSLAVINEESSVRARVGNEGGKSTLIELEVVHASEKFPIDLSASSALDIENRHLWTRSERMRAIVRGRHKILKALRNTLEDNGFISVQTPVTTSMECVCSGTIFKVPFYDQQVFLNQSPWMYVDNLMSNVDKAYALMPSFRKEFKQSPYHLAEVWHVQCDQAWVRHAESMRFEEKLIATVIARILEDAHAELAALGRDVTPLKRFPAEFPRVTYTDAVDIITRNGGRLEWGEDVDKASQNILAAQFDSPFFLIEPPHRTTNFFFNKRPDKPEVAMTHDLYVPGLGEVIGGGERVSDLAHLMENLAEFGHEPEGYPWYVESKKYGPIPHTGFNFGLDRFVMWVLGLKDIREVVPFPRIPTARVYP